MKFIKSNLNAKYIKRKPNGNLSAYFVKNKQLRR